MSDEVYQAFQNILKHRRKQKNLVIDGYSVFLFINRNGNPQVAVNYEAVFRKLVDKYNSKHEEPLPKITPHVCRHTYCSNMAKAGMNPKALQYLMGHSDIGVTLNVYTHLGLIDAKEEMNRIAKLA
ncbi:tyrosine-type recombinase/integrase [Blautia wexlerae]